MIENLKLRPGYGGFLFLAESARNPSLLHSHRHRELELNLVLRGAITYVAGGRRFSFGQRSLLWLFPSQEHQLVDRTPDAQYYVAVFTPELIADACQNKFYEGLKRQNKRDGVLHTAPEPESFDLMRKTMDSLMAGAPPPDVLNREAGFGVNSKFVFRHEDTDGLNAGLRYLLLLCWRCQMRGRAFQRPVALHPAVERALDVLAAADWEGDHAALGRACGVSGTYLSRLFNGQLGVSITRYRNARRLARFWERLHSAEHPGLLTAVYESGFGSYAQFYKVFTEAYGKGPREVLRPSPRRPVSRKS